MLFDHQKACDVSEILAEIYSKFIKARLVDALNKFVPDKIGKTIGA